MDSLTAVLRVKEEETEYKEDSSEIVGIGEENTEHSDHEGDVMKELETENVSSEISNRSVNVETMEENSATSDKLL